MEGSSLSSLKPVKELPFGVYSPNRELVEFIVELRNVPGAIAGVSEELAKHKVNILSGLHSARPREPKAAWSFFADFTGASLRPDEAAETLKKLPSVSRVRLVKAKFDGLIIDDEHFPLLVFDERSLTLRVETMAKMFARLREVLGAPANVLIYEMGVKAGEAKAESLSQKYGVKGREALEIVLAERVAKGWAAPKIIRYDEEKFLVEIEAEGLFECFPFKGKLKEPNGLFFKGYLTGALTVLLGEKPVVAEARCVAKGDPICAFIAKRG